MLEIISQRKRQKQRYNKSSSFLPSFTLMEVLIYTTILSIIVLIISQIMLPVKKVQKHSINTSEVEKNVNTVMTIITYNIRQAIGINSATNGNLSLKMGNSSIDPTLFYLSDGSVYIKQDDQNPYPITTSKVYVDSLSFERIPGVGDAKDSVKIILFLHYKGSGATSSPVTKRVETTVSLR